MPLDTQTTSIRPVPFRTAEGDFIDIRDEKTRTWLAERYPAVGTPRVAQHLSDGYNFFNPIAIIEGLQELGLQLVAVSQQHSLRRDPRAQEHVMRFRFPADGAFALKAVGDSVPELVIRGAHNGRRKGEAMLGVFRIVCSNGLIICDEQFGRVSMRHYGEKNTLQAFGEMLKQMVQNYKVMVRRIRAMQEATLTKHQQNQLARELMKARACPDWVEPGMVLEAHRVEDEAAENGTRSLWVTYNVVQENLTNRKVELNRAGERHRSLRPTTGAMADLRANEALWQVLDKYSRKVLPKEIFAALETAQVEEAEVVEETPAEAKKRKAREYARARRAKLKAEA